MFSLQNIYADSTSECQNSSSFPPLSLLLFLNYLPIGLSICGELLNDWDLSDFSYLVFPLYIGLYYVMPCTAITLLAVD